MTFGNASRYYQRASNQVIEMDHTQLREAFLGGAELMRRLDRVREERLRLIRSRHPHNLEKPGILALHILPVQPGLAVLDPIKAYDIRQTFQPIECSGFSTSYNFDGIAVVAKNDGAVMGYTQVFRDGTVESAVGRIHFDIPERQISRTLAWAGWLPGLVDAIKRMIEGLHSLGFAPPFAVMVSMLEVEGTLLLPGNIMFVSRATKNQSEQLLFEPIMIDDVVFQDQWQNALRQPLFDRLWQAHGYAKCVGPFDDNGSWTGKFGR